MSAEFRELLGSEFPLTPEQLDALEAHYELLLRWNRVLNLTAIRDWKEAAERHYGEALFLARYLAGGSIADIGSGAGFPGFPIAVARPDCTVTLIESHQRKAVFLKEAGRSVRNVRVIAKRAESVTERFDWVVSRAVSYEGLSGVVKRLAPSIALLTGAVPPPDGFGGDFAAERGYVWVDPILLPWGQQRYLRIGHNRTGQDT